MTVRLVLDATALIVYAHGGIRGVGVGETIREVLTEGQAVGSPVLCLAEACAHLDHGQVDALALLVDNPLFAALPLGGNWRALAASSVDHGGLGRGAAFLAMIEADGWLLTAEPERYGWPDAGIISVE